MPLNEIHTTQQTPDDRGSPRYVALMREALRSGWSSQKAAEALKSRILRDERYLAYRRRSGYHTVTDEAIEADLYALAWAACYLTQLDGRCIPHIFGSVNSAHFFVRPVCLLFASTICVTRPQHCC